MQAKIEMSKNEKDEVLTIPESAVLWTGQRSLVYVQPDPSTSIFEMREVELGNLSNGSYAINLGLEPGELVVAKGTFTVDAAAQLQGKKSMMNQDGETMAMDHEGHSKMGGTMKMQFSEAVQDKFGGLLEVYLDLKDALVAMNKRKHWHKKEQGLLRTSVVCQWMIWAVATCPNWQNNWQKWLQKVHWGINVGFLSSFPKT